MGYRGSVQRKHKEGSLKQSCLRSDMKTCYFVIQLEGMHQDSDSLHGLRMLYLMTLD